MNHNDDDIKNALNRGTQKAAGQKDRVWKNVNDELYEQGTPHTARRGSTMPGRLAAAVAAVAIVTVFSFTPPGKAAVARITDLFAPQKTIDFSLEGNQEQGDFSLQTPAPIQTQEPGDATPDTKPMTFVIYVDEAMYQTEVSVGEMTITPVDYPADYPPVYMQITQDTARSPEEVAQSLEAELKDRYTDFLNKGTISDPVSSIWLHMLSGYEWNSEVANYYLVDNTQGGTFIIKTQFFLEAEEGHGARFHYMLKEFQVVPAE